MIAANYQRKIIGSGNLIQTLQAASLIDVYNVWAYPVVLGRGKRLFEQGARPCALRLVASKVSKNGVVMSTYAPAGVPEPGGLSMRDAQVIIRGLQGMNLIGGDICEVLPLADPTGQTALNAANLMFEMLCVIADSRVNRK